MLLLGTQSQCIKRIFCETLLYFSVYSFRATSVLSSILHSYGSFYKIKNTHIQFTKYSYEVMKVFLFLHGVIPPPRLISDSR